MHLSNPYFKHPRKASAWSLRIESLNWDPLGLDRSEKDVWGPWFVAETKMSTIR